MKKVIILIIVGLLLPGCGGLYNVRPIEKEHIVVRNYKLGQEQVAFVGDPVIQIKNYNKKPYMSASSDFVVAARTGADIGAGIGEPLTGTKFDTNGKLLKYPVVGQIEYEGIQYSVISLPKYKKRFLINEHGGVSRKMLVPLGEGLKDVMAYGDFNISPTDLTFTPNDEIDQDEKPDFAAGYVNYELVYTGSDGKSLLILYREYTPDDMARTAFYQNLTFSANQNPIRFKNYLIEVKEATNEKIVFKVIKDEK